VTDRDELWEPDVAAVAPVVGRVDRRTGKPLMRYDTVGEISGDGIDDESTTADDDTDGGVSVRITF
jgi:hypothetical protein